MYYSSAFGLSSTQIAQVFQNEAQGLAFDMMENRYVWVIIGIIPLVAIIPDFLAACISQVLFPELIEKHRQVSVMNIKVENIQ